MEGRVEGAGGIALGGDRGVFATVYELVSGEHLFHVFFALVGPGGEFGFRQNDDVWCLLLE